MRRVSPFVLATFFAVFAGCAATNSPPASPQPAEAMGLVTLLGTDTLAVEHVTRTPDGMEAVVALRAPQTTLTTYRLALEPDGGLVRYEATTRRPGSDAVVRRETAEPVGDSLRVRVAADGETQTRMVAGGERPLPFVDMVHWPYVVVVDRAIAAGRAADQPLFTDRGPIAFTTDVDPSGTVTVTHPFRGPMRVTTDADGRLLALDAGATTRKVSVRRVPDVDVAGFARRSAAADASGQAFGALSGRAEARATVGGAELVVDYGQPFARGREVWGALVPWGEVWRTGANGATQFETSRDLVLGDADPLVVPAGRYSLFTIPGPDGGLLILNRQTGQGGTAYDSAQDFGRVTMTRSSLPEAVEAFTVDVHADGDGNGRLVLQWDRDAFSVPFVVSD